MSSPAKTTHSKREIKSKSVTAEKDKDSQKHRQEETSSIPSIKRYHDNKKRMLTFTPIPAFQFQEPLENLLKNKIVSTEFSINLYRTMVKIRFFEEKIRQLKLGLDPKRPGFEFIGASHLYVGEEAVAIGALAALRPDDYITSTHRGHGHCIAKGGDIKLMMAELLGKKTGYCHGKGGSMHIADLESNNLGANGVVGGSYGIATGAGISIVRLGMDRVVLGFVGDGSTNNGICHESLNMASALKLPVVYLIENNGTGMTVPVVECTNVDFLARRAPAYGIPGEVIDGMDVLAVWDGTKRAAAHARSGKGPYLLECITNRTYGHSLTDNRRSYRTKEEENHWNQYDAIKQYRRKLVEAGVATDKVLEQIDKDMEALIEEATDFAIKSPYPDKSEILDGLYSTSNTDIVDEKWRTVNYKLGSEKLPRDKDGEILFWQAVNEAIREEMVRDRRVVLFGEDVAAYGGAFGATRDLSSIFGNDRIWNTAISEAAIVGAGAGAAMTGLRPIVEIMYIDFTTIAMDQIVNQAAKVKYMFGGKAKVPLVIRTPIGGGRGYAGQHSQSLESLLTHIPGLKVVIPSTPYDAKGLLKTAIRDDNPVAFIEHQLLYNSKKFKGVVPEDEYTIPFGEADIKRAGKDITLVSWSYMVHVALDLADELCSSEGIEIEVIDARTLNPLDINTIVNSVKKTGRCLILSQACRTGSFTGEVASQVQELAFDYLDVPVMRIGSYDCPPPMSPPLETEFLPNRDRILNAVNKLL